LRYHASLGNPSGGEEVRDGPHDHNRGGGSSGGVAPATAPLLRVGAGTAGPYTSLWAATVCPITFVAALRCAPCTRERAQQWPPGRPNNGRLADALARDATYRGASRTLLFSYYLQCCVRLVSLAAPSFFLASGAAFALPRSSTEVSDRGLRSCACTSRP
jgi:hypothetical protein